MSRDGSGTFNRLFNWVDDRDASIPITSSRMDSEQDGIATALTNSIAKDGQTNPTANLPMNGFKHTGVANSNSRTDYAATGQIQDGSFLFAVGGGTANAQTLTLSPAITAYTDGMLLNFEAGATNTDNTTFNVNSVGAQSVVLPSGSELPAGAITSGRFYTVIYDLTNTNWVLIGGPSVIDSLSIISTNTTVDVVSITADSLTTGDGLRVASNSSDTSTRNIAEFVNDNTAATGTTGLNVRQDAAQRAVFIDQNANGLSLQIDAESTTATVFDILMDQTTSGVGINMTANSLTSGNAIRISSNSSTTNGRSLVNVINDNSSAINATCLRLQQDASANSLFIDHNGDDGSAIDIIGSQTGGNVISIACSSLSSGSGLYIASDSSNTSARNLVEIIQDNSSASNAIGIFVRNDGNLSAARFDTSSTAGFSIITTATSNSYATTSNVLQCNRSATSSYSFLSCLSDTDGSSDVEFRFRGDGEAFADGSFNGGGADYAEYFEWDDGNPDDEDRRGISVALIDNKIKQAEQGDNVIGVVSGNPSVVGDAAWNKWTGKHIKDHYGSYIMEDYEVWEWEDEAGKTHSYADYKIPDGINIPDNKKIIVQQRRALNPDWDENLEYIPRNERKEWACVGLMGKLRIRKGQQTNTNWIKMTDVSDSVEEWLVR